MFDAADDVAIFALSHRRGGNSDAAAELVARGVREVGAGARIVALRDYQVHACLACRACAAAKDSRCVLREKDQAESLFWIMQHAPAVVFVSPIYFYALPSQAKTWIDRSQRFWEARKKQEPWAMALKARKGFACLVAGQPQGQKLFEGARLTLKYFLVNFNMTLEEPLGLRGLDAAGDLVSQPERMHQAVELGRAAGRAARHA